MVVGIAELENVFLSVRPKVASTLPSLFLYSTLPAYSNKNNKQSILLRHLQCSRIKTSIMTNCNYHLFFRNFQRSIIQLYSFFLYIFFLCGFVLLASLPSKQYNSITKKTTTTTATLTDITSDV